MARHLICVLTLVALWAALPSADASAPGNFRTYSTCDIRGRPKPDPDRWCFKGDRFGAVAVARHVPNHYRLCFRRPDGRRRCVRKSAQPASPGVPATPSTVALYLRAGHHAVGTWRLKWLNYWHGHVLIRRDRLHVRR